MIATILGKPTTKKNSSRIIRVRGVPRLIPSRECEAWTRQALPQLRLAHGGAAPLALPLNLCALVYRERRVGDLGNYLSAICDALQQAGVVADDRWILGFDGSRLLHDTMRPRVELTLTPLETT